MINVIESINNFSNRFLVSNTENSQGTIFYKSVIYVIHHNSEGAFGLIINQPINHILQFLDNNLPINSKMDLCLGGPVSTNKKFFLHSGEYKKNLLFKNKLGNLSLSNSLEILTDMKKGDGPAKALMILGYSSWGAGRLEYEIENNYWLVGEVDEEIIFYKDFYCKWNLALNKILGNKDKYIPQIEYC